MKIQYASDLHVEFDSRPLRKSDLVGNVLVLAGDIAGSTTQLRDYLRTLLGRIPILVVPGNHEFYGYEFDRGRDNYRYTLTRDGDPSLHFLDDDSVVLGGVRFLGSTLWSDFKEGTQGEDAQAGYDYDGGLKDFELIKKSGGEGPIRWQDVYSRHQESLAWLTESLSEPFSGPTVVITHHAPSFFSAAPHYADSPISGAFSTDLSDLIMRTAPAVWIHGHHHNTSDYRIGNTRVICNPYGYQGIDTNLDWDPRATVTVEI
ncbi:MAG: metallophosphoesterase [Leptospirales bacterium]